MIRFMTTPVTLLHDFYTIVDEKNNGTLISNLHYMRGPRVRLANDLSYMIRNLFKYYLWVELI
jgi:hypothetical protein